MKRTGGATAGRVDKHSMSPEGFKYRPEVEVLATMKPQSQGQPLAPPKKKSIQYLHNSPKRLAIKDRPKRESQVERSLKGVPCALVTVTDQPLEEETFACDHWIGRRVETYWGVPAEKRGFYPGVIIAWKRVDNVINSLSSRLIHLGY